MDQYIKPELFILIPFIYGLGMILKETNLIKDKYIPLVLTAVSLALANLYVIGTGGFSAVNLFMPDGWTVKTADGSLSAHYENTIAITPDGVQILTLIEDNF